MISRCHFEWWDKPRNDQRILELLKLSILFAMPYWAYSEVGTFLPDFRIGHDPTPNLIYI